MPDTQATEQVIINDDGTTTRRITVDIDYSGLHRTFTSDVDNQIAELLRRSSDPATLSTVRNLMVALAMVVGCCDPTKGEFKPMRDNFEKWSISLAEEDNKRQNDADREDEE